MEYIIGIDAGATKSELIAYDLNCNPIYKNIGGYGNPSVSIDATIENITRLIEKTLVDLQKDKCVFMAIGMSGVESGNFHETIKKYIDERFCIENVLLNDVVMAAKAYLGNEDGILTIAGTGSSTYCQKENTGEMVGGWGHVLGDEGSGYYTVVQAFKRVAYKIDNNMELDNLSKELMDKIQAKNASDLKGFIYGNEKVVIASLFSIVANEAKKGDKAAIMLLEDAGRHLAQETITGYKKFNYKDKVKIGIKGGVFHNSDIVYSTYEKELRDNIDDFIIIKEDIPVTNAVCHIYKSF